MSPRSSRAVRRSFEILTRTAGDVVCPLTSKLCARGTATQFLCSLASSSPKKDMCLLWMSARSDTQTRGKSREQLGVVAALWSQADCSPRALLCPPSRLL